MVVPTGYGAFSGWLSLRVALTARLPSQPYSVVAVPSVAALTLAPHEFPS